MTEERNQADDSYARHLENVEKRRQWEEERAARKEQERIDGLRREMAAYRKERFTDWTEHGGEPASIEQVWPQMMKDYLDRKQIDREIARDAAIEEAYDF